MATTVFAINDPRLNGFDREVVIAARVHLLRGNTELLSKRHTDIRRMQTMPYHERHPY